MVVRAPGMRGTMPRRARASRNRNSISALMLRNSAWARRSSSIHTAGSIRSRKAFFSAIFSAERSSPRAFESSNDPKTQVQRADPYRHRDQKPDEEHPEEIGGQARRRRHVGDQQEIVHRGGEDRDHDAEPRALGRQRVQGSYAAHRI